VAIVIYITADGERREIEYNQSVGEPTSDMTKDMLYLSLHKAFDNATIPILYDKNITSIKPRVDRLNLENLPSNTRAIFFTSGTTGEPTGALKSEENITKELEVLRNLFAPYNFERVIVTVPLIHIYGFLAGVMLPKALDADVILKEEFIPHELLNLAEERRTLCITNPVFLKVLNKLKIEGDYSNITFLSSTGKLDADIAKSLCKKIGCKIYQLFGSTETGGVAYKVDDEELWRPLQGVHIEAIDKKLSVESAYLSDYTIESGLQKLDKPFLTTDIIEIVDDSFRLLGRESEIIKISGKRISILEVESLLEQSRLIDEVLVKLSYSVDSHKDEQLALSIVSSTELVKLKKEVKEILRENYKNINIKTAVKQVDNIAKTDTGKKIRR
jgi:acyl-coenzyme A synthetase/AMP-(fatty) acid ligase